MRQKKAEWWSGQRALRRDEEVDGKTETKRRRDVGGSGRRAGEI